MEFELDDYRSGKIKKKRRNLSCVSQPGNYCGNEYYDKKKEDNSNSNSNNNTDKTKTENNINKKSNEKPIYVNSNNNYLITKLKKENETLRLKLSKYEINNNRFKQNNDSKIRQKRIDNTMAITKKILNNKQSITKSSSNIANFGNNTYTNNFYHPKENKYKITNNFSVSNNLNQMNDINFNIKNFHKNIYNPNRMSTNSFVVHHKKQIKNEIGKSLSVFHSTSQNKQKNNSRKIIYDKIKTNYKKIQNNLNNIDISNNVTENKAKEKKDEFKTNNNVYNSRIHTLNNNMYNNQKNVFSWKKKIDKDKNNNFNSVNSNLCSTDRKKTEANISNSNDRNNIFIPNEFNMTWSRFPKKSIETSFELNYINDKHNHDIVLSSKNKKSNENRSNNKALSKINSKSKDMNERNEGSNFKKHRKDITPQKITINRRMINNKIKSKRPNFGSNNISMKNIINIQPKSNKEENNIINISESNKMVNSHSNLHEGDIYVHKKRNSAFGVETKNNNSNVNNDTTENKKNNYMNNKYNVTINNINNCNYISLIQQPANKSEYKIIKKKIDKNINN